MLIPAIHFPGNCTEAIEQYKKVLGAQVINIAYYRDAPANSGIFITEETKDRVMHAELQIAGTRVNVCDVIEEVISGNMFLMNVFLESAEEVIKAFRALEEGGEILTELGPQFWTPMYCAVRDRFGAHWQLMAEQPQ